MGIVVAILLQPAPDSVSGNSHPSFPIDESRRGRKSTRWVLGPGLVVRSTSDYFIRGLYLGEPLWSEDPPMGGDRLWSGPIYLFSPCS